MVEMIQPDYGLVRDLAFYKAGGAPKGQRDIDKIDRILGTVNSSVDRYGDIVKQVLANKKARLEQQPVGNLYGVPSAKDEAASNELLQNRNTTRVPENIFPQPTAQQEEGNPSLPAGVAGPSPQMPTQKMPIFETPTNQNADFFKATGIPAATPMFQVPDMQKLAMLQQPKQAVYTQPGMPPIILPATSPAPTGYMLQGYLDRKEGVKSAIDVAEKNKEVPFLGADAAIAQGSGPVQSKIISSTAQGNSPYANVKLKQNIFQSLPSQTSPTSAAGAAAQVQLAVRQGKGLIAKPGSPQQIALASSDVARAVQRSAPLMETISDSTFSHNIVTQISALTQKITANPNGPDVPKLRRQIFDILTELEDTSRPVINRSLSNIETVYAGDLPANWKQIRDSEMGTNLPPINFQENATPLPPSVGERRGNFIYKGGNPASPSSWAPMQNQAR